jgi:hypothetical protein
MVWTRSETLGISHVRCAQCHGLGITRDSEPCTCVLEQVFKICYQRFRDCCEKDKASSTVKLERLTYSRKTEEYIADFIGIARRALNPLQFQVFRFAFVLAADSALLMRRYGMSKMVCDALLSTIRQRVGRACAQTKPYGLYPLDEYFGTVVDNERGPVRAITPPHVKLRPALRAPLRAVALDGAFPKAA